MFLDHRTRGRELDIHIDLLEAASAAQQAFADVIDFAVVFVFDTEVVIQVNTTLYDLAAAIAFHLKRVVMLFRFGRCTVEEVFEEGHGILSDDGLRF